MKSTKTFMLGYDGLAREFDQNDELAMDAYGCYRVREIIPTGEYQVDLAIMTRPVSG